MEPDSASIWSMYAGLRWRLFAHALSGDTSGQIPPLVRLLSVNGLSDAYLMSRRRSRSR